MMTLQQGEKRNLAELTSGRTLDVSLRHDLAGTDVSVFGLSSERTLQNESYFVFYNRLSSPGGEVVLTQQPWGGTFRLELGRLPASVRRLVFVVTHENTPFSALGTLTWTLGDAVQGDLNSGASLELRGHQFGSERAVMVAEVYERGGEWRVASVGQGFSGGLDALLLHFGSSALSGSRPVQSLAVQNLAVQSPPPVPPPVEPLPSRPGRTGHTGRTGDPDRPASDGTVSLSQFLKKTAEADRPGRVFELESSKMLEVNVQGRIWSKLGAMVAYSGNLSFKRQGMLEGGIVKALVRAVSSEMEPLVKIEGQGVAYLADQAKEITILKLTGDAINVAGHALLAFEDAVEHKVTMHRSVAGLVSGGLFSVLLRGQGMLALLSHGQPLKLQVTGGKTVHTDPNATIGWSDGLSPQLKVDSSLKTIFGRGGGETFQMVFQGEGFVIVQPYEENMS